MSIETYRKRPVEVQAALYDGTKESARQIMHWVGADAVLDKRWFSGREEHSLYIKTMEGKMHVSKGDYVIRGVQGEFYPCKPDIFEATYEKVEEHEIEPLSLADDPNYIKKE